MAATKQTKYSKNGGEIRSMVWPARCCILRNVNLALRLNALFYRHTTAVFLREAFPILSGLSSTAAFLERAFYYF